MDIVGTRTLRDLWGELRHTAAERPFLVFEDGDGQVSRYTYAAFGRLVTRTANLARDLGVRPGDRVVVHLRNCPELLMWMFGLAELGAVMVPLHPHNAPAECADVVARVRADVVVCEPATLDVYRPGPDAAGPAVDVPRLVVARGLEPVPGTVRFEAERDARPDELVDPAPLAGDDPAGIVFTSGTTARPKGVVLTHANLLFSGEFVDWQARLGPADRLLTTMPACHVNFQLNALMPVLTAAATLVMVERYSARCFWRQVCRHEATVVQSIAMIVRTQLAQPGGAWERRHHVREVLYYLPISDEEKARFEERFGTRILNSYGTSETLVGVITDPPLGPRRWPSIGRAGLGYEARVADDDGHEVPAGTVGEIQVRGVPGRTLMLGYFEDPEATRRAYGPDGWMHTGDLGYADADGWFYFVERWSQMIKRAGENVSPSEVEAVLVAHPGVAEAAVVGVPDPIHDEAVKAFVVPAPGARPTPADLVAHCRARLADFKVPTLVEVVDVLPHTSTYKVARGRVREGARRDDPVTTTEREDVR